MKSADNLFDKHRFDEGFDLWQDLQIPRFTISLALISDRLAGQKTVKLASGYLLKPAECGSRILRFMGSDESSLVHHGFTAPAAKKADASYKISASSESRLLSLRRRTNSVALALCRRFASADSNA